MALQLGWQPRQDKPAKGNLVSGRQDLALEITGDAPDVADGSEGCVKLVEESAKGESAGQRLLATFHGTWHREGKGRQARLLFKLYERAGDSRIDWKRSGYDPECMPGLGVDGFALTFLGIVFPVSFPFFVDSSSEGQFLELQAIAEAGAGQTSKELGKSPVYSMRIRRSEKVESTTRAPDGSLKSYEDALVGRTVVHHESYLLETVRTKKGTPWSQAAGPAATAMVAMSPSKAGAFAKYSGLSADRRLRIFIEPAITSGLLPEATDGLWTGQRLLPLGGPALRSQLLTVARKGVKTSLVEIFADAGFPGAAVHYLDDPNPDAQSVARLVGKGEFAVPFFTFVVQTSDRTDVAHAEQARYTAAPVVFDGYSWMLASPFPLGAGDKTLGSGIQFNVTYFSSQFEKLIDSGRPKARERTPPLTRPQVEAIIAFQAEKVAQTIAHEVAHSLGLMHDALVSNGGPCVEGRASPLRSIMSSATDSEPYGAGVRFSNQAKLIWRDCFGLAPKLPSDSLRNKTWKADEWRTVDWQERERRFWTAIGESALHRFPEIEGGNVSPYKAMPNPQPGTYVPPPPESAE